MGHFIQLFYNILLGFEAGCIFSMFDKVSGFAEGTGFTDGRVRERSLSGVDKLRVERLTFFELLKDEDILN